MIKKQEKTNAVRMLERAGIAYNLIPYDVDDNDLSAIHVAESLGESIERIYKTLVLRGDRTGYFVCIVQGDKEVNLKTVAKLSGNKSADLIPMKDLLPTTGYIRGGCSPIGMKRSFPTFIDVSCLSYDYIYISAGVRGLQIQIAPNDLIKFINAETSVLEH